MNNTNEIRSALNHIDSQDRNTWIKIGAALKTELGDQGFNLWDEWSQTASNYKQSASRSVWKSLKPGFINIGTLYFEAKENGYTPDKPLTPPTQKELQERKRQQLIAQQKAEKERLKEIKKAQRNSIMRWNKAQPVDPNHPYLVEKTIADPKILRLLRQEGEKLLLPIKAYGDLKAVQSIDPEGRKMFEKGAGIEGASMIIGSWDKAKSEGLVIAEGFATAASIHQATGMTAIAGFTGHHMTLVAKGLENTKMPIVIAADNDEKGQGRAFAEQAKSYLGDRATIADPIFNESEKKQFEEFFKDVPSDFNDLYRLKGKQSVKEVINQAYLSICQNLDHGIERSRADKKQDIELEM